MVIEFLVNIRKILFHMYKRYIETLATQDQSMRRMALHYGISIDLNLKSTQKNMK